jgi:transcriptional regulator with XRE-family HTH domain
MGSKGEPAQSQSVGQRIAAYRRRRGLSQAAVAGLIGRSESWLSQVERGIHSVDKLSVLLDLAKVLNIDVEALTGRPWELAPNGGAIAGGLVEIRQVFTRYDHLLGVEPPQSPSLPELRAQWRASNFPDLGPNRVPTGKEISPCREIGRASPRSSRKRW